MRYKCSNASLGRGRGEGLNPLSLPFYLFQVRFAALITVLALAEKLKENYLVLLPESIPFLAELMEGNA